MKKILVAAFLFAALQTSAQESTLMAKEFWQEKPNLAAVKKELLNGFDFKNVHGSSDPIFLAINSDSPQEIIKFLIDQPGVDFRHTTVEGRIYLHIAAQKGNAEITDYLIGKGSDVNFLDANGHTALTFAAFNGHLNNAVVDVFLKRGVDLKKKYPEKNGANLLLLAVGFDKDLVITDHLVSKGLSINSTDDSGNTAFDHAVKIGNVELLKNLIKRGVKYGPNVLMLAAEGTYRSSNKIDVYEYLVDDLKVDPLVTNKEGQNVLHAVTRKNPQADVVKFFLTKGVDINKVDGEGNTPFINAAGGKSLEAVEMMLPKVKNINAVNALGESALLNAVKGSTAEVVTLLLKNGADVHVSDKDGNNLAYHLVESYRPANAGRSGRGAGGRSAAGAGENGGSKSEIKDDFGAKLKALQTAGLSLNAALKGGNTVLHIAAAKNDVSALKKLAAVGVDVNIKNTEGITALHKAAMVSKDDSTLRYLLSIGAKKDVKTSFEETAYDLAKENEFLSKGNISVDFLK